MKFSIIPVPQKELPNAPVQTWDEPAAKQFCREVPGGPNVQQVEHEPAIFPLRKDGQ